MHLLTDCEALESIPLKLMIVSIVAAMSVGPAANALEAVRDRDFLSRATAALDKVMWTVEMLALSGPGAVRTLALDFGSDGGLKFSGLVLGDRPEGPNASAVVLRMSNGLSIVRLAELPSTIVTGRDGYQVEISAEQFRLRMEASLMEGHRVITASAV